MLKEYRCTRNALYLHNCLGQHDVRERHGFYIMASSQEEAWEKMAGRFPQETREGFTVDDWQGGDVTVTEKKD